MLAICDAPLGTKREVNAAAKLVHRPRGRLAARVCGEATEDEREGTQAPTHHATRETIGVEGSAAMLLALGAARSADNSSYTDGGSGDGGMVAASLGVKIARDRDVLAVKVPDPQEVLLLWLGAAHRGISRRDGALALEEREEGRGGGMIWAEERRGGKRNGDDGDGGILTVGMSDTQSTGGFSENPLYSGF